MTVPNRMKKAKQLRNELDSLGYSGDVYIDKDKVGIWWNTSRALVECIKRDEPMLFIQDDVILLPEFKRCQQELATHLGKNDIHLISGFTIDDYDILIERGDNTYIGHNFCWAQCYMVTPKLAHFTLKYAKELHSGSAKQHDEIRYRVSSVITGYRMVTALYAIVQHDCSLRSEMGNWELKNGEKREAKYLADSNTDYTSLIGTYQDWNPVWKSYFLAKDCPTKIRTEV